MKKQLVTRASHSGGMYNITPWKKWMPCNIDKGLPAKEGMKMTND